MFNWSIPFHVEEVPILIKLNHLYAILTRILRSVISTVSVNFLLFALKSQFRFATALSRFLLLLLTVIVNNFNARLVIKFKLLGLRLRSVLLYEMSE